MEIFRTARAIDGQTLQNHSVHVTEDLKSVLRSEGPGGVVTADDLDQLMRAIKFFQANKSTKNLQPFHARLQEAPSASSPPSSSKGKERMPKQAAERKPMEVSGEKASKSWEQNRTAEQKRTEVSEEMPVCQWAYGTRARGLRLA